MELAEARERSLQRLRGVMEDIITKYNHAFENTDVVDLDELDLAEDYGLLKAVPGPYFGVLGQGGRAHHRTKNARRRQPHTSEGNAQGESEEDLDELSADENDDDDEDGHNLGYIWDDEEGGSEAEEVDEATAAAEEAAAAAGIGTEMASPLRREAVLQQDILCEDDGDVEVLVTVTPRRKHQPRSRQSAGHADLPASKRPKTAEMSSTKVRRRIIPSVVQPADAAAQLSTGNIWDGPELPGAPPERPPEVEDEESGGLACGGPGKCDKSFCFLCEQ